MMSERVLLPTASGRETRTVILGLLRRYRLCSPRLRVRRSSCSEQ